MAIPAKNDGKWNMYREIVQQSPELEEDLITLHRMLESVRDFYEEMDEKHGFQYELPGWVFIYDQLFFAIGMPEILLGLLPGEAEKPE
jgi:hypothetical protein